MRKEFEVWNIQLQKNKRLDGGKYYTDEVAEKPEAIIHMAKTDT